MRNPQIANIASIALLGLLSSQAFAWSIDGVVKSKISGRLLGGVKISTFNLAMKRPAPKTERSASVATASTLLWT